jgi:hypothetical protein
VAAPRWPEAAQRLACLLPGIWAGLLLGIAALAAPAAFALLPAPDAGRVVGRLFRQEAWLSLVWAGALLVLLRRQPGTTGLLSGAVACTLLGYFVLQPLMSAARSGQSLLSFGQWHALGASFYGLKTLFVLMLAWRSTSPASFTRPRSS